MLNTIITGVGAVIPEQTVPNTQFLNSQFHNEDGSLIKQNNETIIKKFVKITGIESRKYVKENQVSSDIAAEAGELALQNSGINREGLDLIIVAQNFGDVQHGSNQVDQVPSIASRVKAKLGIHNPKCVAFDLIFGCPGWIQSVITAEAYFKAGMAKSALIIGSETLSRVVDPHDRDCMIFADGAGATVLEAKEEADPRGILSMSAVSHAVEEVGYLDYSGSYNPEIPKKEKHIKMLGRKIYEYALTEVPAAMKDCVDKSGIGIDQLKKVFIHQANEKMDEAILERFYKLYDMEMPKDIMPMNIHFMGNSSVATVPTLLHQVMNNEIEDQKIDTEDVVLFASVGAGMNINAFTYKF